MRYIITGKYANGDDYMESVDDPYQLSIILGAIAKYDPYMHMLKRLSEDDIINPETIKIETEEA